MPGYQRTRIGNRTQFWQQRTSDDESPSISELDQLVAGSRAPEIEEGAKVGRAGHKRVGGIEIECAKRALTPVASMVFCFDSKTNDLVEVSAGTESQVPWRVVWREYANFQEWAGKRSPRLMRGYNGKKVVAEAQFDEIQALPQLAPDYFTPGKNTTIWAYCAEGSVWKLKNHVSPVYPRSARMERQQGTVELYGVIGEDGRVSQLRMAHSAGPLLNQSAITAVSSWLYERTSSCADSKGPSETFIDTVFSIKQ